MADQIHAMGDGQAAGERVGEPAAAVGRRGLRRLTDALSAEQLRALAVLSDGRAIPMAAEAAGVSRGTVYRWIKTDPQFRAAHNAWQLEQRESCRAALQKCAEEAVARIAVMVTIDQMLAFKVAKEMGLFIRPRVMSIDPEHVQREIEAEQMEEAALLNPRRADPPAAKTERIEHAGPESRPAPTAPSSVDTPAERVSRMPEGTRQCAPTPGETPAERVSRMPEGTGPCAPTPVETPAQRVSRMVKMDKVATTIG